MQGTRHRRRRRRLDVRVLAEDYVCGLYVLVKHPASDDEALDNAARAAAHTVPPAGRRTSTATMSR
ncbi:hypothetical protein FHS96_001289 [Sphingomonas zeicaulis]|uniref:hypothetical protein n=1 Tax=Sphingomonas zeicaulis TaxID=1632740 RepID=UPI003D1C2CBC